MSTCRATITGVGKYLPSRIVKNKDLETLLNTSDDWIKQRTGIEERRWVESPSVTTTSLALEASRAALKDAGKTPNDIDAIIFATLSPDYFFPGCGVLLQRDLCRDKTVPAVDVRTQCSGFLYSLSIADAWIRMGQYKTVLVVGSEIHSTGLDLTPEGRDVSVLFGDGAGAVVVEATTDPNKGILASKLHSEGQYAEKLWTHRPSSNSSPQLLRGDIKLDKSFFPEMDGKFVFKNAVTRMSETLIEVCKAADVTPRDIDFVIAHQANLRINTMVLQQLEIPLDRTLSTIQKYGNTTAATLPIGMEEAKAQGLLKPGQLVAMVAFGSGFTWGANLMRL